MNDWVQITCGHTHTQSCIYTFMFLNEYVYIPPNTHPVGTIDDST